MADALTERQAAVEAKTREYENLLRNVYPEIIAERLRLGETAIAETLQNVSLIVIAIDGLDTPAPHDSQGSALARLTEVIDALDDAAARHGVEKIKTLGETYAAASGLSVARLDHARRALAFVAEAAEAIRRLSHTWQDDLALRATVVSGEVEAGLVGRHRTVYDIWGTNFLLARRIVFDTQQGHVRVTAATREMVPEMTDFEAMPPITLVGRPSVETWQRPLLAASAPAEAA
jgi:class 3 adenylate cyclase